MPSVVFSTGTTPKSALPRSTSSKTPGIVPMGDAHVLREAEAGAEDLLEDRPDRLGGERSGVGGGEPLGDLALTRRYVEGHLQRRLEVGDGRDEARALVEEAQDLIVGGVDLGADLGELGGV